MPTVAARSLCVLGAGSWGTALASHLAGNGHNVVLWGRSAAAIEQMKQTGVNQRYLPDAQLHPSLRYSSDISDALGAVSDVLVAVPSHGFANAIDSIVRHADPHVGVFWACKGFESGTGRLLSELIEEQRAGSKYAIISGPTFAAELVAGLPTAITVAASNHDYARQLCECLHNDRFRVYSTDDIRGVQIGGALKNVYAIAAGISDGLGFGANARTALITRGLAELMRLAQTLGASRDTLMGLSGMGDLILTCTDNKSRNRRFGLELASGLSVDDARDKIGQSVEGISATRVAQLLSERHSVELPIVEQLCAILNNKCSPRDAVDALLSREIKAER